MKLLAPSKIGTYHNHTAMKQLYLHKIFRSLRYGALSAGWIRGTWCSD